jgi:hypothetical protein
MDDETEKPKRKYTRRLFSNDETQEDVVIENDDGVETEPDEAPEKPLTLGAEPTTDSTTAKMLRKFGIGGRMEPIKPWKGHDRWQCSRCKWETFDRKKAKTHVCA